MNRQGGSAGFRSLETGYWIFQNSQTLRIEGRERMAGRECRKIHPRFRLCLSFSSSLCTRGSVARNDIKSLEKPMRNRINRGSPSPSPLSPVVAENSTRPSDERERGTPRNKSIQIRASVRERIPDAASSCETNERDSSRVTEAEGWRRDGSKDEG